MNGRMKVSPDKQPDKRPNKYGGSECKEESFRIFDRIHKRYDLLNRLFSFGRDISWRRRLSRRLPNRDGQKLLDLATGTGDVAFSILKHNPCVNRAFGCDMAANMLMLARSKARKSQLGSRVAFLQGDAGNIPFSSDVFDTATMAFGIRNVPDPLHVLTEIIRVLKKDGRALILEFSLPRNPILRKLHLFYLRTFVPWLGAWVSGDKHAYRYLNTTIESFPYGEIFCRLMKDAGFREVAHSPLTFGVATIYQGEK